jgi:hypothetical protein
MEEMKCQNSYVNFMMDFVKDIFQENSLPKRSWLDNIIGPYCFRMYIVIARNVRYIMLMQTS